LPECGGVVENRQRRVDRNDVHTGVNDERGGFRRPQLAESVAPGIRLDEVTAGLLGDRFEVMHDSEGRVLIGHRDGAESSHTVARSSAAATWGVVPPAPSRATA
jgi:hypothetical protein